ncbi:glycoside hydrolase family 6 protein [Streptomyces panaciradicis]|uniref:glycoside hydrolase family 6 protein n=1 Tax=Streptomyces panaciradicis TaxID=1470261 RepID=UPI00201CC188|nr:glycoside hydrolase family 6 protein [Streptomyces panaciradicis]MCL6668558.1 glycoside hydrolase family 6 protein [Streptomyces panaciradicis]
MVAAASAVVAVATVTGAISALDDGRGADAARSTASGSPHLDRRTAAPSPSAATPSPSPTPTSPVSSPGRTASAPTASKKKQPSPAVSALLYRHPDSHVLDWVRAHPTDPRTPVIQSRIADRPAAVWLTDPSPSAVASQVRAVTSGAAAQRRVPVLVAYAIPDRDCGGASRGGVPDLAAYDGWIDAFASGLGSGEVVVVLEPDSLAQAGCLSAARRAARLASLARAGRVLKAADPEARVYYDAGHSGWHPAGVQAALLRQAGAASPASSDGIFSNVSNFRPTSDEITYDRRVLDALGGPARLGAVIDTSRNGNGAPADGSWCDPAGRRLGQAPTLRTGQARVDAYLWVKLPGESDGCKGAPGTFSPSYAYALASS